MRILGHPPKKFLIIMMMILKYYDYNIAKQTFLVYKHIADRTGKGKSFYRNDNFLRQLNF